MIVEDILTQILSCFGKEDDTVAKGLLSGKVGDPHASSRKAL